ncbi:hypothetical protein LPN01_05365 [Sphingomonas sp. A2-49]|uniref:hypothetical protein n=1 Tax=Sphingomonas sp. A2-49 TaxID=1391375 RepID=UPI0021CF8B68|nr:hypothetical protein [Sphingomonas sp. A2-49]MCU6453500.1 hypothetical protein [Sphingomonas sp. A2-49]
MFGSSKPIASLSSGLLARKGQARPAMRSQGFGSFGSVPQGADDLGWNDMGTSEPLPAQPVPDVPVAAADPAQPAAVAPGGEAGPVPLVLVQRALLSAQIAAPEAAKSVSVATATRIRRETQHGAKAAFTLRVDADRHLRLRLASAITNRSAQDLVTEALDALLGAVPEVEALVAQLPPAKARR